MRGFVSYILGIEVVKHPISVREERCYFGPRYRKTAETSFNTAWMVFAERLLSLDIPSGRKCLGLRIGTLLTRRG
jgi:hypothetical protein